MDPLNEMSTLKEKDLLQLPYFFSVGADLRLEELRRPGEYTGNHIKCFPSRMDGVPVDLLPITQLQVS